jgi:hypothetical protein
MFEFRLRFEQLITLLHITLLIIEQFKQFKPESYKLERM